MILHSNSCFRQKINQNTFIFVSPNGNDNYDGLASNTPKATLQDAANTIKSYDHNGYTMSMIIADGNYLGGFSCTGAIIGNVEFQVVGNLSNPENVIITIPQNQVGFYAKDYGAFTIQGVTMQPNSSGSVCIGSGQFGIIDFQNVIFGYTPSGIHINIQPFGSVNALSGYAISGGAVAHINNSWGNIDYQAVTQNNSSVAMLNTPAWTNAGVVTDGGRTYLSNTNFGGTGGTGRRWLTSGQGKIITDGVDPNSWALGDQNGQAL